MAKKKAQKIFILTREYDGLAGAGGVKDFSRQLAEALVRKGRQVSVLMPLYGFIDPQQFSFKKTGNTFAVDLPYVGRFRRETVTIWSADINGVTVYLFDTARYREKLDVYVYTDEDSGEDPQKQKGMAHYDFFAMNVLLQKAAIAMIIRMDEKPDVIHCQDGHTAILPAMIREIGGYRHYFGKTGCVVTVHNAGHGYHQEITDLAFAETITGLPSRIILDNLLGGNFDPLLAASSYSVMNTVSENYARELRETDDDSMTGWFGHKLLDRGVVLEGVTNGINPANYDPAFPERLGLTAAFAPEKKSFAGKARGRATLIKELAVGKQQVVEQTGYLDSKPSQPLFTFVGRLTPQKGVDKMIGALETLLPMDKKFQVLILGSGSPEIEKQLIRLASDEKYRGRICLLCGYDQVMANRIYAAGDFLLLPSKYEPCGLTDFIGQLFGNLPIVHHIGGLVKVIDGETGLAYRDHNSAALMGAILKALVLFRKSPEKIHDMRQAAVRHIQKHYTWDIVVERYLKLYAKAMKIAGDL
ncbi:MAG: glycogen/starch synthase [Desulfobulbaceae bacterium]|nr:glycogen/starch synthase [Desulfobulbaceae bacterium]